MDSTHFVSLRFTTVYTMNLTKERSYVRKGDVSPKILISENK